MITDERAATAIRGRTARACESCLRRRARWFCAADDAFLCGGCDASVHSANQLARRHERVRLETPAPATLPSNKPNRRASTNPTAGDDSVSVPAWHGGFTRKARTPRKKSQGVDVAGATTKLAPTGDLVPELSGEFDSSTASMDDSDDGLPCVPVFDDFSVVDDCELIGLGGVDELDIGLLLPSEADLEEFATDMESLLGKRADENVGDEAVKVKDELLASDDIMLQLGDDEAAAGAWEVTDGAMDWDLEFRLPASDVAPGGHEVEEEKPEVPLAATADEKHFSIGTINKEKRTKMLLQLNYDDIITAWAGHGSPWSDGTRPNFSTDDVWPDCKGSDVHNQHTNCGDTMGLRGHPMGGDDKGREARVSRYREKRRTRMFSKKIRYQVRKLNAEKRPRMKGRFVKRTPSFPYQS